MSTEPTEIEDPVPAPPALSIIIPTYREAENLPDLLRAIDGVRREHGLDAEVLLMDDDSPDETRRIVADLGYDWVHLHVRTHNRGLSPAVLDGLTLARGTLCVVMDADLSHPPERIPDMIAALNDGADLVIGSRYAPGGSTDARWGLLRRVNSRVATLLARPFTNVKDPMSGFLAFRRRLLDDAAAFNPVGYKIGLELIVKCRCQDVREVPIHFADRTRGRSKLTVAEQLRYLQHLRRLAVFRYPNVACLIQFLIVGASGVVVNLVVLTALLAAFVPKELAIAAAIVVSIATNFLMNRRFTFSYARKGSIARQFLGFVGACSLGAVVNYAVTLTVLGYLTDIPQLAALVGIVAGTGINFTMNRLFVFKRTLVDKRPSP
ncbi:MAG: glycosyltransferase family 2 protein [Phycisphaerae bacterium]|nr:glycosyltransferase family 2 protein [Phycisphaerae bacterium]